MTLFNNNQFAKDIINQIDADRHFNSQNKSQLQTINTLIEIQTRHLIENAIKFMNKDARCSLCLQDILDSSKMLNHSTLKLDQIQPLRRNIQNQKRSSQQQYIQPDTYIEQQLKMLQKLTISQPKLQGKWIIIKNKIPTTSNNLTVKSKLQILKKKSQEDQQNIKLFKIIKDDPISLLTLQQYHIFTKIIKFIQQNDEQDQLMELTGDLNDVVPFILKHLGQKEINEAGIKVLLNLINNKHVWLGIQYNLKKTLNIFLNYEGKSSLQVGFKIAQLVQRFNDKYPKLRDIYIGTPNTYSNIMKKIPFEIILGIPLQIDEQTIQKITEQSEKDNEMAKLCMKAFLTYSNYLISFRQYMIKTESMPYWLPNKQFKNDHYLNMY